MSTVEDMAIFPRLVKSKLAHNPPFPFNNYIKTNKETNTFSNRKS